VSVREQTFQFGTRKLGVQKILGCLETGTVRGHGEDSVAHADARRRNHVGIDRIGFDRLLAAWVIRVSHIHRFIPYFAGHRAHYADSAFLQRESHHIRPETARRSRDEPLSVCCRVLVSRSLRSDCFAARITDVGKKRRRSVWTERHRSSFFGGILRGRAGEQKEKEEAIAWKKSSS
jgi:hypothetical protein